MPGPGKRLEEWLITMNPGIQWRGWQRNSWYRQWGADRWNWQESSETQNPKTVNGVMMHSTQVPKKIPPMMLGAMDRADGS